MDKIQNQEEILVDKNSRGKDRNWRGRKILSLKLADIFKNCSTKIVLLSEWQRVVILCDLFGEKMVL